MRSSSSSSSMFDLREAVEGLRDAFTPRGDKADHTPHRDVRAAVLMALLDQARTGAEIIDAIAADANGHWRPKPGAVYPLLQLLADEGLVASEQRDEKKVYALTEAGRTAAEQAAAQVAQVGTADQKKRAAELLDETRKRLYAILAED